MSLLYQAPPFNYTGETHSHFCIWFNGIDFHCCVVFLCVNIVHCLSFQHLTGTSAASSCWLLWIVLLRPFLIHVFLVNTCIIRYGFTHTLHLMMLKKMLIEGLSQLCESLCAMRDCHCTSACASHPKETIWGTEVATWQSPVGLLARNIKSQNKESLDILLT